jgi:hypothetical protein
MPRCTSLRLLSRPTGGDEAKGGLKVDYCTLRYSAGRMARRFVGPENLVYTHGRTFIKDSLQARCIAELVEHLGVDRKVTIEQIEEEMKKLSKYQLKNDLGPCLLPLPALFLALIHLKLHPQRPRCVYTV